MGIGYPVVLGSSNRMVRKSYSSGSHFPLKVCSKIRILRMPHVNVKVVSAFFSFSQITTLQKLQLILIVFFVCITQSNVEACTLNKAKEKNELVGPVHTVITKMRFDTTTDTYDPSGNLVESVTNWSYEKDSRQSKVMFTCDQQGRLTMEVTFHS